VKHACVASTEINEDSKGSNGSNRSSDNITGIDRARFTVSAAVTTLLGASLTRAFLVAVKVATVVVVIPVVIAALACRGFIAFRNSGNREFLAVRVYAENADSDVLSNIDSLGYRADEFCGDLRNVEKAVSSASNVDECTEISDGDDSTVVGLADFEVSELHGAFRPNKRALSTTTATTTTAAATTTTTAEFASGRGSIFSSRSRSVFGLGFGSSDGEETLASIANYTALL
jgi:hypothetical protein